jgi:hypothetical protein
VESGETQQQRHTISLGFAMSVRSHPEPGSALGALKRRLVTAPSASDAGSLSGAAQRTVQAIRA